jgi:restriction endonuclease Mrr
MSDYIALAEEAWRWRHESAAATASAADLTPEERLRVLDQVDQMRGTRGPLVYWACTYAGARAILCASLRRGHVEDPAAVVDEVEPDAACEMALRLIGVRIDGGHAEGGDSRPPRGATS